MLADKVAAAREQQRAEAADRRQQVLRRLAWSRAGLTRAELMKRLGWSGGIDSILRELAELGEAVQVGDAWRATRPPARPAAPPGDEPLRAQVYDDVAAHPDTSSPEVALRLGLARRQVSIALQALRLAGRLEVHGQRRGARWRATSVTPGPAPLPPADIPLVLQEPPAPASPTSPVIARAAVEDLLSLVSLLDEMMDALAVPPCSDRRARLGMCVGMYMRRS